jgi:hypothetical protein
MNEIHEKHTIQKHCITFQSLHKYLVAFWPMQRMRLVVIVHAFCSSAHLGSWPSSKRLGRHFGL